MLEAQGFTVHHLTNETTINPEEAGVYRVKMLLEAHYV